MSPEIKNRLELLVMSGIASVGMFVCQEWHMWCGHLEHSSHDRIESWAFDSIWIFALSGVAVVGIRGRFNGARPIGIICALLIVAMAALRFPLGILGGLVLAILTIVQLMGLVVCLKTRQEAEKAAPSNGG